MTPTLTPPRFFALCCVDALFLVDISQLSTTTHFNNRENDPPPHPPRFFALCCVDALFLVDISQLSTTTHFNNRENDPHPPRFFALCCVDVIFLVDISQLSTTTHFQRIFYRLELHEPELWVIYLRITCWRSSPSSRWSLIHREHPWLHLPVSHL